MGSLKELVGNDEYAIVLLEQKGCMMCRVAKKFLEEASNEPLLKKFKVYYVDIENNPDVIQEYNVRRTPTLLFFVKGELKRKEDVILTKDLLKIVASEMVNNNKKQ